MEEIIDKITNPSRKLIDPDENIEFSFTEKTRQDLNNECQNL